MNRYHLGWFVKRYDLSIQWKCQSKTDWKSSWPSWHGTWQSIRWKNRIKTIDYINWCTCVCVCVCFWGRIHIRKTSSIFECHLIGSKKTFWRDKCVSNIVISVYSGHKNATPEFLRELTTVFLLIEKKLKQLPTFDNNPSCYRCHSGISSLICFVSASIMNRTTHALNH